MLNKSSVSIFIIWLFVVSGLIGIALGYFDWFIPKTPLNLLIGAALIFWNFPINSIKKLLVWTICFIVGMGVEIAGVKTGIIFGTYYYGENLGAKFMEVPYLIGVYWAVLAFAAAAVANRIINFKIPAMLLASILMVGLDCLMEIMAVKLDFWHFTGGLAPLRNYAAWFIIALFLQVLIFQTISFKEWKYSLNLYLSQAVFFGVCYLLLN